jgi:hypothetical protein
LGSGAEAILLDDRFADGGVFSVVLHDGGNVGLTVSAPIGSDAQKLVNASGAMHDVAGIYRALRPELEEIGEEVGHSHQQTFANDARPRSTQRSSSKRTWRPLAGCAASPSLLRI